MPYLKIRANRSPNAATVETLLKEASKAVASALGKPEGYMMVDLDAPVPLRFAGTDAPAAFVELKSIGLPGGKTGDLSALICKLIKDHLDVDPGRIYIEFADAKGSMWGWNGGTF